MIATTVAEEREGALMCNEAGGVADSPEEFVLHLILVFALLAWNRNLESNIHSGLYIVGHPDTREAASTKFVLYTIPPGQHFPYAHRVV